MRKKLVSVGNGRGVVIDETILELIGASEVGDWELTTDGHRLVLEPVRVRVVRKEAPPPGAAAPLGTVDFEDPKDSVKAIEYAQACGFTPEHFRRIHHFGPKASLQNHIRHCLGTTRFTSKTNVVVCKRLVRAIELRGQGFGWDDSLTEAIAQFPFPPGR